MTVMTDAAVAERLRVFLLATTIGIAVMVGIELWLEGHTGSLIQWIPFVLAAVMALASMSILATPARWILRLGRASLVLVFLGGLFGIYEHIEHNIEFALEIRPNATISDVWFSGADGANPLLAPGIICLGATLGLAGTYRHPAMRAGRKANTNGRA